MKEYTNQNHDHIFQGEEAPRPTLSLRELELNPNPKFVEEVRRALFKFWAKPPSDDQGENVDLHIRVTRQICFLFPALSEDDLEEVRMEAGA